MTKLPSTTTLLLSFFLLVQLPLVVQPIGGGHVWRQADTAAVARNLALESFDPFHPRVDVRQHFSGITGMEFPVYQSLVGLLYLAAPTTQDWPGHLVSLLMAFGCLGYTLLLARRLLDLSAKWVVCAMICLQEFFLLSTRIMPETTALCLVLMGTWHFLRYRDSGNLTDLLLAWLGYTLGLLARPYVGAWGLVILMEFLFALRTNPKRSVIFLALGVIILIPFALWYFVWSPHLTESYGLTGFFYTGGKAEEILADLTSLQTWIKLTDALLYDYAHWLLVPFVLIGLRKLPASSNWSRDHTVLLVGVPLLTLVVVLLLTGAHFKPHTYYLVGLVPVLAIFAGMGLSIFERRYPKAGQRMVFLLPVLTVALLWYIYPAPTENLRPFEDVISEVERKVLPEDLVIAENLGSLGYSLHPIRRRGWVVSRGQIQDLAFISETGNLGARWVLPLQDGKYQLHTIADWQQGLTTQE